MGGPARGTRAVRGGVPPPVTDAMRQQALDSLIEERVITTYARQSGIKVDDAELDRAVQSVAAANRLTLDQLRARLRAEGIDYARFRSGLRDQIVAERVREREVIPRIRIQDVEVDEYLAKRQAAPSAGDELNLARPSCPTLGLGGTHRSPQRRAALRRGRTAPRLATARCRRLPAQSRNNAASGTSSSAMRNCG